MSMTEAGIGLAETAPSREVTGLPRVVIIQNTDDDEQMIGSQILGHEFSPPIITEGVESRKDLAGKKADLVVINTKSFDDTKRTITSLSGAGICENFIVVTNELSPPDPALERIANVEFITRREEPEKLRETIQDGLNIQHVGKLSQSPGEKVQKIFRRFPTSAPQPARVAVPPPRPTQLPEFLPPPPTAHKIQPAKVKISALHRLIEKIKRL
jgi:hypothetical protein